MKKNYVPTTLDQFLNESKTITLKRGYGQKQPVVVGANAPLRNQVLAFVSESVKVTRSELKRFIAGLNEGSKNPIAATNMWLQRNEKFFVTESKNGETFYKLSPIGKRLAGRFVAPSNSNEISESLTAIRKRIDMQHPLNEALRPLTQEEEDYINNLDEVPERIEDYNPFANAYQLKDGKIIVVQPDGTKYVDESGSRVSNTNVDESADDEENFEPGSYDFVDRRKGYARPGIYDMDEGDDSCEGEECCIPGEEDEDNLDESTKSRIKRILENIKAKDKKVLNEGEEEDDEKKSDDEDELTFDDLELGDEDEEDTEEGEDESKEDEGDEEDEDETEEGEEAEEDEEKVEITEFIITVDNVEEALEELEELGVTGEQVLDEEGEPIEDQIKVSADDWDELKGWLEEKGVDIEEMFGGEIETEDEEGLEGEEEELEGEEFEEEGEKLEGEGEEFEEEGEELKLKGEDKELKGEEKVDSDLDIDKE